MRQLSFKVVYKDNDDVCKDTIERYRFLFPKNIDKKIAEDEIREKLFSYCSCEHDCCGHFTGGVIKTIKVKAREYVVYAKYARNY